MGENETVKNKLVAIINGQNHHLQTTPPHPLVSSPASDPIDDADPEKLPLFTNELHHIQNKP